MRTLLEKYLAWVEQLMQQPVLSGAFKKHLAFTKNCWKASTDSSPCTTPQVKGAWSRAQGWIVEDVQVLKMAHSSSNITSHHHPTHLSIPLWFWWLATTTFLLTVWVLLWSDLVLSKKIQTPKYSGWLGVAQKFLVEWISRIVNIFIYIVSISDPYIYLYFHYFVFLKQQMYEFQCVFVLALFLEKHLDVVCEETPSLVENCSVFLPGWHFYVSSVSAP